MDSNKETIKLPPLKHSGRIREFKYYSDELKAIVIYEHLFMGNTHRWLDKNVLGVSDGRTNGRISANILYYLGMKANYRGIFEGVDLDRGIKILEYNGKNYEKAVHLLKLFRELDLELNRFINNDLRAEQIEDGKGLEGTVKYYYGKRYERNQKNREIAIKKHGLNCIACGFNFEEVYGSIGKNFIEIHHIKPLSTFNKETEVNPETDLVPLCANCHRMVHRKSNKVLSIKHLQSIINKRRINDL